MRAIALSLAVLASASAHAQAPSGADPSADLRRGKGFISTTVFSEEEDRKLLAVFDGLRVADVTDGMDAVGLQNVGLMDPGIRPLWKDAKTYPHRFVGIAVTARYVPTNRAQAGKRPTKEYDDWAGAWYDKLPSEPFEDAPRKGSARIIGDGVLVVPRAQAEEVARYARKIIEDDKQGRRELYRKLGLPADPSIR